MAGYLGWLVFYTLLSDKNSSWCKWLLLLVPLLFILPPAIALATPLYILYAACVFGRRVIQPGFVSNPFEGDFGQHGQLADLSLFQFSM